MPPVVPGAADAVQDEAELDVTILGHDRFSLNEGPDRSRSPLASRPTRNARSFIDSAKPLSGARPEGGTANMPRPSCRTGASARRPRSEEHTSELQSLMRISYAVFCL